ncbi:MAG: transcriptional repressor LexA [bacterium]
MNNYTLSEKEIEALRLIRNSMMQRGFSPSVRELMISMGYSSPRSTALIVNNLIDEGFLRRKKDGGLEIIDTFEGDESSEDTVEVPMVGTAACGAPMLAEENIEEMIPVSVRLAKPPHRYFLLRAKGDSMNLGGIQDGDAVLVKRTNIAVTGDQVVALIDGEATIKEYHKGKDTVILRPKSKNKIHKPIILTDDFLIQGVVVRTIEGL